MRHNVRGGTAVAESSRPHPGRPLTHSVRGTACAPPPAAAPAAGPSPTGGRAAGGGGGGGGPQTILALDRALADSVLAADAARTGTVARLGYQQGMMAMLAPDVVYLRAGQPLAFGQSSVQRLLAIAGPGRGTALRWQPIRVGVSRDGLAAYAAGIAAMAVPGDSAAPLLVLSRYVAFWRREPGSAWRTSARTPRSGWSEARLPRSPNPAPAI